MNRANLRRTIGRGILGAFLVIAATIMVLFLLEGASGFVVATRALMEPVTFMGPERQHTEYDERLGWRHKADVSIDDLYGPGADFRTNSQRLRADHDYTPAVPPGKARIVCTGDSFTMGHSVGNDEGWCARLQQYHPDIETVNMGQAAYGLDQVFLWYERDFGWLAHNVQLFAFIDTDFERMETDNFVGYPKPVVRAVNGKIVVNNVPVPATASAVPRATRLAAATEQLRIITLARAAGRRFFGAGDAPKNALTRTEVEQSVSLIFEELKRLNEQRGSQLVLLFLPRPGDESFQWADRWRSFVGREAERLGVPFVDLIPDIRALRLQEVEPLYVDPFQPSHYSVAGNEWVARTLLRKLGELGIVKN